MDTFDGILGHPPVNAKGVDWPKVSAAADADGASWFVEFAADASWFEEFAADGVVRDIGARYVGRSVRLVSGL